MTIPEVRWHDSTVVRATRWAALGRVGGTIWFTGLPGSGKSTVAVEVERRLVEAGVPAFLLDGDNLRHGLNADLGFSAEDRAENVRRVAEVARLFAESSSVAVVSLVSPYAEGRRLARKIHEEAGLAFAEIYVDTPPEECERRDPKGLYARARAGQLRGLTGVDDVYERPEHPDLALCTTTTTAGAGAELVLALLVARGVLPDG